MNAQVAEVCKSGVETLIKLSLTHTILDFFVLSILQSQRQWGPHSIDCVWTRDRYEIQGDTLVTIRTHDWA